MVIDLIAIISISSNFVASLAYLGDVLASLQEPRENPKKSLNEKDRPKPAFFTLCIVHRIPKAKAIYARMLREARPRSRYKMRASSAGFFDSLTPVCL